MDEQTNYWSRQVVLITGSSRGLGSDMAKHFSKLGCKVAINYKQNRDMALEVLSQCQETRTKIYGADVAKVHEVKLMCAQIEQDLGPISILINNAGQTRDQLLMSMSDEEWHSIIDTHLHGTFYCLREVLPMMLAQRFGRIINISSVSALRGQTGQTNYSAAKAALIGLSKSLAKEVGKKNITCNALVLGAFKTDMTDALSMDILQEMKKSTAVKRLGSVEEATAMASFLASEQSSYVTGQAIVVDGGML